MPRIVVAGFGGQGVLFSGKLLAQAAIEEGKFTTFFPSYGAEMRGGTAHCLVNISTREIASPFFRTPDFGIFLNEPSAKKFLPQMKKNSLVILNSSLIKKMSLPKEIEPVWIPATEFAQQIGNQKIANLVAIGAFSVRSKVVSLKSIEKALNLFLSGAKAKFLALNLKALYMSSK